MEDAGPANYGSKTIGFIGSLALLLNNILGPAIANLAAVFQRSGWLMPLIFTIICSISSIIGGFCLIEAMRRMPNNRNFQQRVEFGTMCRHYFPRPAATASQVVFQLSMLSMNISNIIQTAQVFDYVIDKVFSNSCAIEFYPNVFHPFCDTEPNDISPFGSGKFLLSIGLVMVAIFSIPLGYWNLDDNVVVQNLSLVLIIGAIALWLVIFQLLGLDSGNVPAIGNSFTNIGGTILFNFMFISTIPSWICEKSPNVNAMGVVTLTLGLAFVMFVTVGILGGMAFAPFYSGDNTLLSKLDNIRPDQLSEGWRISAGAAVDTYAVASNLASVPIFSIMIRYNLVESGVLGARAAGFIAVVVPWVTSVVLYTGNGFKNVVNLAGTFTSSYVNFLAPCLLFIASSRLVGARDLSTAALAVEMAPVDDDSCGSVEEVSSVWQILAWVNLVVMLVCTGISVSDLFSS